MIFYVTPDGSIYSVFDEEAAQRLAALYDDIGVIYFFAELTMEEV